MNIVSKYIKIYFILHDFKTRVLFQSTELMDRRFATLSSTFR